MLFNSFTFLLFFAIVLALHYLPLPWRVKKTNLLLASYLFYAAWNPPFVVLLWISTIVDWYCARWIHAAAGNASRRVFLVLSLVTNLGLLGFFKYYNFLLDSFVGIASSLGVEYAPPALDIVLPVGISFYTFQSLSYTIDVYRKNTKPWESPLDFALYVTFFPQLVAGPIVRAIDFLPQCTLEKRATAAQFAWGISLLVLGLFEKVVLADGVLAPVVEEVYGDPRLPPGFVGAWCGTLAFASQIFCDFAGYSTCAIGVAMCLGFAIPDNFHFPYAAIGFSDFWRRWHISLSSWLRDYLYIPLGGNRHGVVRTYVHLSITMLLGGLWHGASWRFVVWGALHGLYLIVERLLCSTPMASWKIWTTRLGRAILMLATFAAVCVTWVFFRADSFHEAFVILKSMFGFVSAATAPFGEFNLLFALAPTMCIVSLHWLLRDQTIEDAVMRLPRWLIPLMLALMLVAIVMMPGEDRAFIYFQF